MLKTIAAAEESMPPQEQSFRPAFHLNTGVKGDRLFRIKRILVKLS